MCTCVHAKSHGPAIFFRGLWGASGAPTVHNLLTEAVQVVREGPGASGFLSIAIPPTLSNLEVAASALGSTDPRPLSVIISSYIGEPRALVNTPQLERFGGPNGPQKPPGAPEVQKDTFT